MRHQCDHRNPLTFCSYTWERLFSFVFALSILSSRNGVSPGAVSSGASQMISWSQIIHFAHWIHIVFSFFYFLICCAIFFFSYYFNRICELSKLKRCMEIVYSSKPLPTYRISSLPLPLAFSSQLLLVPYFINLKCNLFIALDFMRCLQWG